MHPTLVKAKTTKAAVETAEGLAVLNERLAAVETKVDRVLELLESSPKPAEGRKAK